MECRLETLELRRRNLRLPEPFGALMHSPFQTMNRKGIDMFSMLYVQVSNETIFYNNCTHLNLKILLLGCFQMTPADDNVSTI